MKTVFYFVVMIMLLQILTIAAPAAAGDFATDYTKPLLGLGVISCFTKPGSQDFQQATRVSESVLTSVKIAELVKDGTDSKFPSGHAAAAFSMAASLSHYQPKNKIIYYTLATAIGYSAVKNNDHTLTEVIGGAALGITMGNYSVSHSNGIIVGRIFKF